MQAMASWSHFSWLEVDKLGERSETLGVGSNCGSWRVCQGGILRKNGSLSFYFSLRCRKWFCFIFSSEKPPFLCSGTLGFDWLIPISDFLHVCCIPLNDGATDKGWVSLRKREIIQMPAWPCPMQRLRHNLAKMGTKPPFCHMLIAVEPQIRAQLQVSDQCFQVLVHRWSSLLLTMSIPFICSVI